MRTVGSLRPFWYPWLPPEKAVVSHVEHMLYQPNWLTWHFDGPPIDDAPLGSARPSLRAMTNYGWWLPETSQAVTGNAIMCRYRYQLTLGAAVAVYQQPLTFHFPDRLLRIPYRGCTV